jgi:beta-glucosidase
MEGRANRYFKSEPLYPFGYGLSYSKFAYSNLKMLEALVEARQPLDASVTLTTEGQLVGDEVVVLYLNLPRRSGSPVRALRGFHRVHPAWGYTRN